MPHFVLCLGLSLSLITSSGPTYAGEQAWTWLYVKTGLSGFDCFGHAVVDAGDMDGDGLADFGASSPCSFAGSAGEVWVYSGRDGRMLRHFVGGSENDEFGSAMESIGDADGDGVADLAVGAPGAVLGGLPAGAVYVFSGATGNPLYRVDGQISGSGLSPRFGTSIARIGDLTADGRPEFVVGAPFADFTLPGAGATYIISGATGQVLDRVDGTVANDRLGESVAALGDVNGDGVPDFLSVAPGIQGSGSVRAFSGASTSLLYQLEGPAVTPGAGANVADASDLNGDSVNDFLLGVPNGGTAGRAAVHSGANGDSIRAFEGTLPSERFGASLAARGDVNGDGISDLVVGAPLGEFSPVPFTGVVYVYSGSGAVLLFEASGQNRDERFGSAVDLIDDMNGDGRADVVVGAPARLGPDGVPRGAAVIFALVDFVEARGFLSDANAITLGGGRDAACIQLEPQNGSYDPTDLHTETLVLRPVPDRFEEARALPSMSGVIEDSDLNGIVETRACFSRDALRALFPGLVPGRHTVEASLEGTLENGKRVRALITLNLVVPQPNSVALAPNPFADQATLTFWSDEDGEFAIELFDSNGRRVSQRSHFATSPGYQDVAMHARSGSGQRLPSGVYYIRISGPGISQTRKAIVLR